MKKTNKKKLTLKNVLIVIFVVYAFALLCITSFNPSYAKDGILLDSFIDGITSFAK